MSQVAPTRALREPHVLARINAHRATLWRWIRAGTFPRPIKLGGNTNAWIESEIEEWFAQRMAARPAPTEKAHLANARTEMRQTG